MAERRLLKTTAKRQHQQPPVETDADRSDAHRGYEAFYRVPRGTSTLAQIVKSSAGVAGWANFARVMGTVSQDSEDDRR